MQFTEPSTLAMSSVIYTGKPSLYGQKNTRVQRPHLWQTGVAKLVNILTSWLETWAPPLQPLCKGRVQLRNVRGARPALAQDFWFCF